MLEKGQNITKMNINHDDKFLTKYNIIIILISLFLMFLYTFIDVILMSGDYDIKLYTTGIHGIGDAIAKILKSIFQIQNESFNGWFAACFFAVVNLFLFIFISFPKLDLKFSLNSLINIIGFFVFLFILTYLINNPKGMLKSWSYCFGWISKNCGIWKSLLRVMIVSIFSSFTIGMCINIGSSTGGIDIIAKYLVIYKNKTISTSINVLNFFIAIFSIIFLSIWDRNIHLVSLLLTFIKLAVNSLVIYITLNKINLKFIRK
ncbi:YitT family protein [Candidatus Phytoplasma rubi]|uniref:YitT family protein n=1 Tax=Candidatus Phytoplasma rubi TaxID=399025 RepID=A0ABY7BQK0_9MOLU|nr:YitT family protein [Candidatus Phytoplasma rubi]WAN63058.1 YitT family protein [Candidatus Phytoplasma rubi]